MAEIGKLEAKEEGLREDLDNAVDELEDQDDISQSNEELHRKFH